MAQWTSIEDETGMTLVQTSPHFCFEDGKAAFRTDDVDVTAAVIDGRLLKVVVADDAAVEAVGFIAMREKVALSVSADLGYVKEEADRVGADLLIGEGALGGMTAGSFTYASTWTFATNTFTRTAGAGNPDIVHDDAATAGKLYKIVITMTRTAGSLTPQIGANDGTARSTSGTFTEYVRATDTTAFTLQADATFAGTVTAMYCYLMDETGIAVTGTNTHGMDANGDHVLTYSNTDTLAKLAIDDLLTTAGLAAMVTGNLYALTISAKKTATDTTTLEFFNDSDECLMDGKALTTSFADYTVYFHYITGLYLQFDDAGAGDVAYVEQDGWAIKEVHRLGTDAVVIMNSDGEKYQWEVGSGFEFNSTSYTFDIYEMQGGTAGETRMDTAPQTQMDQGLLSRQTSRDSAMEYPDHKDMEDFD